MSDKLYTPEADKKHKADKEHKPVVIKAPEYLSPAPTKMLGDQPDHPKGGD